MKKRVTFYWWDWKEQPNFGHIQQALQAVFNGICPPYVVLVPDPQWDQTTLAICSEPLDSQLLRRIFLQKWDVEERDDMMWWDRSTEPLLWEVTN